MSANLKKLPVCAWGCGKPFDRHATGATGLRQKGHASCYNAYRAQAAIAKASAMPRNPVGEAPEIVELRRAHIATLRKLAQKTAKLDDLVNAVREGAREAAIGLSYIPVSEPKPQKQAGTPETAIAVLADWQLGKKTPSYSSDVCAKRIEKYAEKVVALTQLQRAAHPIRNLRVYILGDIVEGELIFPGQAHLIDASLFAQIFDGRQILANFLRRMLAAFDSVHVETVIGNHGALGGRSRRDYHPESNADAILYETTRLAFEKEKRLSWGANVSPGERKWYAVDRIGDHGYFMFHGDQIPGSAAHSVSTIGRQIYGWASGAIREPFTFALYGHWHTPRSFRFNNFRAWCSGSTESDNTYAQEKLAAVGRPEQWLLFAHPKRGVTAEYLVSLD